jgi:hypothetical protein
MSNYTKTTDFEAKDSLPTGDSEKIIRGSEFETEFDAISTAIATKADTAGPTFTGTLTFATLSDGAINVTAFVDEDNMASDSATLVPTQQSVKAYVDAVTTELNAQDLDFQADSGGALSIDLDSEALTLTGGTGIDTSGSGNAVTFDIDSTVTTLTGTQTLTNKTLTAPVISGNLTTDGTIDGRDVATDGAKLDGIEAGATADQTAAEIRTLVESATDSNVFTDADHTKLDGIEASATADQTDAEIRAAVEAATDSNVFTDADHTKLDGIEASADVTDTANVTAAGALMDSEVTNLAQVKAFDSSDYATAAQGSTADSALQNVVEDTTPQLGGDLASNGNDILFADSDKAVFGTGSDLQIYHDGSNGYINNTGTGSLFIQDLDGSGDIYLRPKSGQTAIGIYNDNTVEVAHAGNVKLATTSTGIDVTGTVTADGLTVDGDGLIQASTGAKLQIKSTTNFISPNDVVGSLDFVSADYNYTAQPIKGQISSVATNPSGTGESALFISTTETTNLRNRIKIDYNGDISFYEDTGTTAKLFWDASAESLGIGTSSPSAKADLVGGDVTGGLRISTDKTSSAFFAFGADSNETRITSSSYGGYQPLTVYTGGSERMRIDSSGNVGIGTSSPANTIHVEKDVSGDWLGRFRNTNTTNGYGVLVYAGDDSSVQSFKVANYAGSGDYLVVRGDGNVGIGTSSPDYALHVSGGATNIAAVFESTDADTWISLIDSNTTNNSTVMLGVDTDDMVFRAGGAEYMRLDNTGNVGIGTSSPSAMLTLDKDVSTLYDATDDDAQRSGTTTLCITNENGTQNTFAQIAFDLAASGQSVARIVGLNDGSSTSALAFVTEGSNTKREVMRLDGSGNVGIGTDDPTVASGNGLAIFDSTVPRVQLRNSTSGDTSSDGVGIFMSGSDLGIENRESSNIIFYNNTEKMRIDSSGNLLVGTTSSSGASAPDNSATASDAGIRLSPTGFIGLGANQAPSGYFNRIGNDGDIIKFNKDGTPVGSIGSANKSSVSRLMIGTGETNLYFFDTDNTIYPVNSNGTDSDADTDLGASGARFKDIYATNGTIQTSDRNEKQDIEELSDAEQRVAVAAKGLLRKFRWIDSVADKGDDARIHFGIIAQDLQDAFTAEGLDAGRYAMFINNLD